MTELGMVIIIFLVPKASPIPRAIIKSRT